MVGRDRIRTVVAGTGRDEDAGGCGVEECEVLRGHHGARGTAADRVVDHVDAVGDGLIDRGDEVAQRADVVRGHGRVGPDIAGLVRGDLRPGSDARDGSEVDALDRGLHPEVARRRARRVRAVTVAVPRREVVVLEVEARGLSSREEVLPADELRRVVALVPVLPFDHGAAELPAVGLVEVHVGAVGVGLLALVAAVLLLLLLELLALERRVLGGDAGVDHAHHDALSGLAHASGLLPHAPAAPAVVAETEVVGRRLRIGVTDLIGEHAENILGGPQLIHLVAREVGAEPVEHDLVGGVRRDADIVDERGLLGLEVLDVALRILRLRLELLAFGGLRRLQSLDVAFVAGERIGFHDHDVVPWRARDRDGVRHLPGRCVAGCGRRCDEQRGQGGGRCHPEGCSTHISLPMIWVQRRCRTADQHNPAPRLRIEN